MIHGCVATGMSCRRQCELQRHSLAAASAERCGVITRCLLLPNFVGFGKAALIQNAMPHQPLMVQQGEWLCTQWARSATFLHSQTYRPRTATQPAPTNRHTHSASMPPSPPASPWSKRTGTSTQPPPWKTPCVVVRFFVLSGGHGIRVQAFYSARVCSAKSPPGKLNNVQKGQEQFQLVELGLGDGFPIDWS